MCSGCATNSKVRPQYGTLSLLRVTVDRQTDTHTHCLLLHPPSLVPKPPFPTGLNTNKANLILGSWASSGWRDRKPEEGAACVANTCHNMPREAACDWERTGASGQTDTLWKLSSCSSQSSEVGGRVRYKIYPPSLLSQWHSPVLNIIKETRHEKCSPFVPFFIIIDAFQVGWDSPCCSCFAPLALLKSQLRI